MKYSSRIISGCVLMFAVSSCGMKNKAVAQGEAPAAATKTEAPALSGGSQAPGDDGFVKSPDGLDYKIITKGTGTLAPKPGDYAEIHVKFKIGDTVMINTQEMNMGKPVPHQFQKPTMKGDLMEGLMRMKAGDSVVFRMLMDTLSTRAHQEKPSWAKPGDYAVWEVKMVSIKTKAQAEAEEKTKENAQKVADDKLLQDYFKSKKITNVKKAPSGLYYVVHKPGAGVSPKNGQQVTVNYSGQTLQGEKFDSNVDPAFNHVEPFSFLLGKRNVIKGWDEGVILMKKGMTATFYIPSWMAYGERGAGGKIGPNAILIFDIELLSFK